MVDAKSITEWKGIPMSSLINTVIGRASVAAPRRSFLARLNAAMALRRSRARLASLDTHLLEDIGLDRAAAEAEANRPVWDAPSFWIK
jgi:uncharacterized protein YjiS (DUF1127 family)